MARRGRRSRTARIQTTVIAPRRNPYTVISRLLSGPGMEAAREILRQEGDYLASKIQLNILQQLLPMKELKPSYLEWKKNQEPPLDPRKLIATGEYVNSIAARPRPGGDTVDVNVPDATHSSSGLTMRELARVHEYGQRKYLQTGKGIPPRPHWRPTIRWWKKHRAQHLGEEINEYVRGKVFKRLTPQLGKTKTHIRPKPRK